MLGLLAFMQRKDSGLLQRLEPRRIWFFRSAASAGVAPPSACRAKPAFNVLSPQHDEVPSDNPGRRGDQ
jgi:hypothetical protein